MTPQPRGKNREESGGEEGILSNKKKDEALQMETCLNEVPKVNWNVSFNQGEIGEWG